MTDNKRQPTGKNSSTWWLPALNMFAKLSVWIAAPVIIALYLGNWLDRKYGTEPWLFLATIGVAFIVSMTGLVINTLKEFKKIEGSPKMQKSKIKNQNDNSKFKNN
jgi:F0F1-type ATP synthase assembly protein I